MRVGVVGDLHLPWVHDDYLGFVKSVFRFYRVERKVLIGDVVDHHAVSNHPRHELAPSGHDEAERAREAIVPWYRMIGNADVTVGNHDIRPWKYAAQEAGISPVYMRSMSEVWETPKWRWVDEVEIDGVLYTHGTGMSGQNAAIRRAIHNRQSVVMGHVHAWAGVQWAGSRKGAIFGCLTGVGCDDGKIGLAYGKNNPMKSVLGCAVVIDGKPIVVTM